MIRYIVFSWFIQDSFAVFSSDALLVPDVFLLCLLYMAFLDSSHESDIFLIWVAFAGGLLWDFRWIGIPGVFALLYVAAFLFARWTWNIFPESGHTITVFFIILWGYQMPGFAAGIYIWNIGAEHYLRSLFLYQAYAIPLAAFFSLLYARKMKIKNA